MIRHGGIDSATVLYIPGVGADAATTIYDYSQGHKTITVVGNAQIDTAQYKFPPSSILFDGTGDYLTLDDSADWYFGTGNFTIHVWVRFAALPGSGARMNFYCDRTDATDFTGFGLWNNSGTYQWDFYVGSGPSIRVTKNCTAMATNTWYHIALVRSGNSWYIFQDGTQCGTTDTDADPIPDRSGGLRLGCNEADTPASFLNGWLAEYIIVKGFALWTANFTPPTRRLI